MGRNPQREFAARVLLGGERARRLSRRGSDRNLLQEFVRRLVVYFDPLFVHGSLLAYIFDHRL